MLFSVSPYSLIHRVQNVCLAVCAVMGIRIPVSSQVRRVGRLSGMPGEARGWLDSPSEEAVRNAVRRVAPALARLPVVLNDQFDQRDPLWHRGSAWLGDDHIVKFAWSEQAAAERLHEVRVVRVLAETRFAEWMPTVAAASERPVLLISRRVTGMPVDGRLLAAVNECASIAAGLARALAVLHDPTLVDRVTEAGISLPAPRPQAEIAEIRARLPHLINPAHAPLVAHWCDWVDGVQSALTSKRVLLHGDLHGHNLLCDDGELAAVLDYDAVSAGDHHYDFRYLPAIGSNIRFFRLVAEEYERATGRWVMPAPVLAWHIRTALGDALWRTEAGVALPDEGTVGEWIISLRQRIAQLESWRPFDAPC